MAVASGPAGCMLDNSPCRASALPALRISRGCPPGTVLDLQHVASRGRALVASASPLGPRTQRDRAEQLVAWLELGTGNCKLGGAYCPRPQPHQRGASRRSNETPNRAAEARRGDAL